MSESGNSYELMDDDFVLPAEVVKTMEEQSASEPLSPEVLAHLTLDLLSRKQ